MAKFPDIVPVFPLPTVVFFPKTYLPLHIFEPRYREMIRDSLDGSQMIAIALLREGWEKGYYGNPEIYPLGCLGKMVKAQELGEGRYNILLYGLVKVLFLESLFEKIYRQARIEPVPLEHSQTLGAHLKERFLQQLREYGKLIGAKQQMDLFLKTEIDDETLVNLFSSELNFTVVEKQFLLEAETLTQRCRRLMELIQFKIHEVTSGHASG